MAAPRSDSRRNRWVRDFAPRQFFVVVITRLRAAVRVHNRDSLGGRGAVAPKQLMGGSERVRAALPVVAPALPWSTPAPVGRSDEIGHRIPHAHNRSGWHGRGGRAANAAGDGSPLAAEDRAP